LFTIVNEEALSVMKPHSPTPLNTRCPLVDRAIATKRRLIGQKQHQARAHICRDAPSFEI